MRYSHIIAAVRDTPWAIRPEKLQAILNFLSLKAEGGTVSQEDIAAIKEEQRHPYLVECETATPGLRILESESAAAPGNANRSRAGAIAVLPLHGVIAHRMGGMDEISGGTSTERFSQWFKTALNDAGVSSIVIDVNSPGGTVNGVQELADEIFQARGKKPVYAVANAQAASAAYYLASQADELSVTPSGDVGSIGVFAAHEDMSKAVESQGFKISLISAGKYKTEANPFEPLSEEARAALQEKVNEHYDMFVSAVARGRGVSGESVRNGFGQGRMVNAKAAVSQGMADRVATLDQTLRRLGAKAPGNRTPMTPKQMAAMESSEYSQEEIAAALLGVKASLTPDEAGYMELAGAEKDGTCDTVNVPGGVSLDKGCCNYFTPVQEADDFSCGDCIHSSASDNEAASSGGTAKGQRNLVQLRRELSLHS